MERRMLGTSGIEVSVLALGCWPFSGGMTWGDQDDADSIATVHAALDLGINLFDTAEGYEHSEEVLGQALSGRRDEAVIATKVSGSNLSADRLRHEPAGRVFRYRYRCNFRDFTWLSGGPLSQMG